MIERALLFGLSVLVVALFGVFASGMFPAPARPVPMRGGAGTALLAAAAVLTAALAAAALLGAWSELAWPYVLIAGGLGALFAPPAFQALPARFQDTPRGAAAVCGAAVALLGAWMVAG